MHQQAFLPIFCGGINFISTKFIALVSYLGNWALVAPIITIKFLVDHCPFLLEAIGVNNFSPFPFHAHLKMAQKFLPPNLVGCIFHFMQFVKKGSNELKKSF
jgi:hypothetical protein